MFELYENKSMEIKEIENLAKLCRIELSNEEKEEFSGEISSILEFIQHIQDVKIDTFEDENSILRNIMREDENPYEGGAFTEALLAEAPEVENNYIKVKNIF